MRRGSRLLLFLLVLIVILGGGAYFFLMSPMSPLAPPEATPTPPIVTIVVAGQPIKRDAQIAVDALSSIAYPQDKLTDKMITNPDDVVGMYAVYPLAQGMPITRDMLAERPGTMLLGSEGAKAIPPGMTAISIPLSRLGIVGYGVQKGDRVNVIVSTTFVDVDPSYQSITPNLTAVITGTGFLPETLPILTVSNDDEDAFSGPQGRTELDPTLNQAFYIIPSEAQRPRLVSQLLLQDVQVLQVGDFEEAKPDAEPVIAEPTPTPQPGEQVVVVSNRPQLVTLIVTPQDAVTLTYLVYSNARLTLTLRSPDDDSRVETEAATLQYLLSQYAIPVPAKLPYALNPAVPAGSPLLDPQPWGNDPVSVPAQ